MQSGCFQSNFVSEPSPAKLLSMAITKRRDLMSEKTRDYRRELLINGTIQKLCKHIGEQRAQRKRRSSPPTQDQSHSIPKHFFSRSNDSSPKPLSEAQTPVQSRKRPATQSEVIKPKKRQTNPSAEFQLKNSDKDPFGLDDLFKSLARVPVKWRCRNSENWTT